LPPDRRASIPGRTDDRGDRRAAQRLARHRRAGMEVRPTMVAARIAARPTERHCLTPDAWREIERLVHEALCLDPVERAAFTERIADARIRAEVESLLAADSAEDDSEIRAIIGEAAQGYSPAPSLLATPGNSQEARSAPTMGVAPSAAGARQWPAAIGRYRILRLLGEGGMGVVYEAEQEQPRRKVALQGIKTALGGPAIPPP